MYYTIWKRPFNIRFEKKNFYSAGARTHESETRPEEICGNESLGEIELFSYKYSILVGVKILPFPFGAASI